MTELEPTPDLPVAEQPDQGVRPLVYEDLERNRLTVFFRFLLVLPHLLWLALYSSVAFLLSPIYWLITLIKGRPPESLQELYGLLVRYSTHVYAYGSLASQRFPGFLGEKTYTVDVAIPPPAKQNRWSIAFRGLLGLPPLILASSLVGGSASGNWQGAALSFGLLTLLGILAWFSALVRGRIPAGMRDLMTYTLTYAAQVWAYLLLVTGKYPNSDPALVPRSTPPPHPIRLSLDDDLRRSRLTVGFRALLVLPHYVWLTLWTIPVLVSAPFAWLATLIAGRLPTPLHRFYARFVRYAAHVVSFGYLVGNPFPGFTGAPGSYPVDVTLPAPGARQSRWVTGFRWLLVFPAFLIIAGLSTAVSTGTIGAWFVSLFTARMPRGLRNLMAFSTRYNSQVYAYALLLTDRYPNSATAEPDAEAAESTDPVRFDRPEAPLVAETA